MRWKTKAGTVITDEVCELEMKFAAFDKDKEVIWNVYVEPEKMNCQNMTSLSEET